MTNALLQAVLTLLDAMQMAERLAKGAAFLEQNGIVNRDIAVFILLQWE